MIFSSEQHFEDHLRLLLKTAITNTHPHIYALQYRTVGDIVICRDGGHPAIFFLEVKYFQKSKGRLGLGSAQGKGIQPEFLQKKPQILESNLKWILGSDSHGDGVYWLIASETIREYASGGVIGNKQNNIQEAFFREQPSLTKIELQNELLRWLTAATN